MSPTSYTPNCKQLYLFAGGPLLVPLEFALLPCLACWKCHGLHTSESNSSRGQGGLVCEYPDILPQDGIALRHMFYTNSQYYLAEPSSNFPQRKFAYWWKYIPVAAFPSPLMVLELNSQINHLFSSPCLRPAWIPQEIKHWHNVPFLWT
jgi:hypothetical protein